MLRQYAHLTTLLQSAFPSSSTTLPSTTATLPTSNSEEYPAQHTLPISISLTGVDPSGTSSPTLTITYPRNYTSTPLRTAPINTLDDLLSGLSVSSLSAAIGLTDDDTAMTGTDASDLFGAGDDEDDAAEQPPPTITIAASILPNADVAIAAQDLLPELVPRENKGKGTETENEAEAVVDGETTEERRKEQEEEGRRMRALGKMGRALEFSGDVGVWVEWVGGRMGGEGA